MSQRYFLTTESAYEALRLALDAELGFPKDSGTSIFTPALEAPRDSLRRIVLAVDDALPYYTEIIAKVAPLLSSASAQELTEAEYLAFLVCVTESGGSATFTTVTDTLTYTNFLPEGGDLATALSEIDSAIGDRALASDFDQGLKTTDSPEFVEINFGYGALLGSSPARIEWPSSRFISIEEGTFEGTWDFSVATVTGIDASDVGAASLSHAHSASDITSGTIDTARLGSGTANNTTYLRGDQTWATVTSGSTSASDLTSGTLGFARLPDRVRSATSLYLWSSFR